MSTKTVKSALRDMLEDLDEKQRKKFCAAILDRREEPRVRRAALENKDIVDITDALVTHFTESGAKEVALQTLREIGCNAQRESFAKDVGGGSLTGGGSVSKYGDVMKIETNGASWQTAQQDKLKYSGVKASHAMAESDLIEMNKYKSIINSAARKKGVDPALIAALISRSCRAGKTLAGGWGCYDEKRQKYNTFGLMQIDVNPNGGGHTPKGSWNSEEHLCQAIDILIYFIIRIKHTFPEWSKEQQLRGGIAAYNAGDENILSYEELDSITTGGDYSSDVIARAQWYKCNADF
ncbi:lysozyme g isoform X1 [Lates calcarifer]|uniref:Lysozyme g n=1 Tax=Lates calcarifer TaxID=8187 RepID=A0A4W6FMT3_LATCA|nr:lysozyme g isoform X1 [Lates calcarifer]